MNSLEVAASIRYCLANLSHLTLSSSIGDRRENALNLSACPSTCSQVHLILRRREYDFRRRTRSACSCSYLMEEEGEFP